MCNFIHWGVPLGRYKESSIGRECGDAALEHYTETRAVYFNAGLAAPKWASKNVNRERQVS